LPCSSSRMAYASKSEASSDAFVVSEDMFGAASESARVGV